MVSFHAEEALEQIEGDKEGLEMLFDTFRRTCPLRLEEMQQCLRQEDAPQLAAVAHRFKGSLGLFAAHGAMRLTERIEAAAQANELAAAGRTLEALEAECTRLQQDLTTFFDHE